ncbi:MAG: SCO family protein [Arcobacter sp.]|nr:SCO family protein [Arcobacter sp.]
MLSKKIFFLMLLLNIIVHSKEIGLYENQGIKVPLDLEFTNEYNQVKSLKDILNNKPTIVTINYFNCPSICSPLLYATAEVIEKVGLKPAEDFNIITLSIEKDDTYLHAKETKDKIFRTFKNKVQTNAWSFLTTKNQENIDLFTDSIGFKYEKRIKDGVVDYLHPAALVVLTPTGRISRYLNGIRYLPFDLKLALLEASDEKTRPTIAKTLLYCFAYDAESKKYIFKAEKIVGGFIFACVLIFFLYLVRTGRKKENQKK